MRLESYQEEAVRHIVEAVCEQRLRRMRVSVPSGMGIDRVVLASCEALKRRRPSLRFFLLVAAETLREQLTREVTELLKWPASDHPAVRVLTEQRVDKLAAEEGLDDGYACVFCLDCNAASVARLDACIRQNVLISIGALSAHRPGGTAEPFPLVYAYTREQAVRDGVLSPAEVNNMYEEAVLGFCHQLFAHYGATLEAEAWQPTSSVRQPDFLITMGDKRLVVECKSFRDRRVSTYQLQHTVDGLSHTVSRNTHLQGIILLLGEMTAGEIRAIYDDCGVSVWDVANLLFLTRKSRRLRRMLGNLTQFPINTIAGREPYGWYPTVPEQAATAGPTLSETARELTQRLRSCETGQAFATQYEEICTDIIKFLFMERFSKMRTQCRTKDGLFRMDMVCALKEAGSFWGLIRRHYNSHFIVFECKNSASEIPPDWIYATEKYLFNAALRNVSIILSRHGFSRHALLAADGCLKENGKLILSITDDDLVSMIDKKLRDEDPADYLMDRLEDMLMPIGK